MSHPLQWEFPGGKMKPGESPERCIIREIFEELNARISVDQLLPSVIHDYGLHKIKLIPFVCTLESENISLQQHKNYVWIEKHELVQYSLLEADLEVVAKLNGQWKQAFP
jgi:8-oxo-dGTP diphosphatase